MMLVSALLNAGPFEKNHELVDRGMQLYEQQKYEEAVAAFDAALKERPEDARIHYDRGLALFKAGKNAEGKEALLKADTLDKEHSLASKIHYNLGNIAAADKDNTGAVKEYRQSLKADASDGQARHNLEVAMKNLPPKSQSGGDGGADGGSKDAGQPDSGSKDSGVPRDAGSDAGRSDAGRGDAGQPDAGSDGGRADSGPPDAGGDAGQGGDAGPGDGGRGDAGQKSDDKGELSDAGNSGEEPEPSDAGASDAGKPQAPDAGSAQKKNLLPDGGVDISKLDAEKMLDSFKNKEKNLQLWRFKPKTKKSTPNGKDW
jgi:tetratricopeptide (TPR) repeat protein